jgi:hypothetical protein
VNEYKKAIMNLGRKNIAASAGCKQSPQKNVTDRAVVTEDQYNVSDTWLIDDVAMIGKAPKNASSKRKISKSYDSDSNKNEHSRSPQSKKRLKSIENYEKVQKSVDAVDLTDLVDTEEDFMFAKFTSTANLANNSNVTNFDIDGRLSICDLTDDADSIVTIHDGSDIDPVKLKSPNKIRPLSFNQAKTKKQLKINKMDSFELKSVKKQPGLNDENSSSVEDWRGAQLHQQQTSANDKTSTKVNWKIKANIEKRNLLIPVMYVSTSVQIGFIMTVQLLTPRIFIPTSMRRLEMMKFWLYR